MQQLAATYTHGVGFFGFCYSCGYQIKVCHGCRWAGAQVTRGLLSVRSIEGKMKGSHCCWIVLFYLSHSLIQPKSPVNFWLKTDDWDFTEHKRISRKHTLQTGIRKENLSPKLNDTEELNRLFCRSPMKICRLLIRLQRVHVKQKRTEFVTVIWIHPVSATKVYLTKIWNRLANTTLFSEAYKVKKKKTKKLNINDFEHFLWHPQPKWSR